MGKRLAPALAALVLLLPVAAHALVLGNMTMNSALNQPLDAEIDLISVQSGDLENLSVRLGTAEDFDRVGVIREFFYTKFNFALAKKSDGTSYVQVTTTDLITEPFLDFVVEVRWARARILRKFTVLVDPPALSAEAPSPMQPAMQEPVQPAPIRERAELKPGMNTNGELSYGPVKYKDALFDIASKMRPDDVTTNQMMLALARNNPKAFYNGNINQMKAGFVLRVDDRETLASVSEADAKMEVNRQHVEWIARNSGKIIRQTSEAPAGGKVSREDKPRTKPLAVEQVRLKLVAPGSEGDGSGVGDEEMGRMREDLLLAAEALNANKQETDELKTRMAEMEKQLESMQSLIMLKDDEMMAIQKQFGKEAAAEKGEATSEALIETAPEAGSKTAATGEGTEGMLEDPVIMYGAIGLLALIAGFVVYKKRQSGSDEADDSRLDNVALDLNTPIASEDAAAPADDERADDSLDFDVSDLNFTLDDGESDDTPVEASEADTALGSDMGDSEPAAMGASAESSDETVGMADERSELGEIGRFEGELTGAILKAFAREHGAHKPKAKKQGEHWVLSSSTALPLHISNEKALILKDLDWLDLMQSLGYEVPAPKAKQPPILNFKAAYLKGHSWGGLQIFRQIELTKVEYSAIYGDYRGVKLSECGEFKFKVCKNPEQRGYDAEWCAVLLTDSKQHPAIESIAIINDMRKIA